MPDVRTRMTSVPRSHRVRHWPAALLLAALGSGRQLDAGDGAGRYLAKPDAWFAGTEARRVAAVIMSHQSDAGGWAKNTDTTAEPYAGDRSDILPTFDNRATVDELRFMARICDATSDAACLHSFGRGLDYVLAAQYPNGGWPQCYPLRGDYSDHITFNDDAMVRVMQFMQAVGNDHTYAFVADAKRLACRKAFAKGVECILKCQIVNAGRRTVWCAQHDAETLAPAKARAYELPSFSGSESVGIVRLLMSIDQPAPEIRDAVEAAVRWLDEHAIAGQRLDTVTDESGRANRVLAADPAAGPLWARFYDLETGRPFVCDRDGIPKAGLAEIGFERRNGYSWFSDSARKLLEEDYPAWKRQAHGQQRTRRRSVMRRRDFPGTGVHP